jgi:hypothetical protein
MCYIGQTIHTLHKRKNEHIRHSRYKTNIHFYNALNKYGIDNFEWTVIDDTCQSKEELDEMEFHYIKQYHSHISEYGYNMTWGGEGVQLFGKLNGMYGKKRPDMMGNNNPAKRPESRKKISDALKGRKKPHLSIRNQNNKGKTYEEIYGVEKAKEIKKSMSEQRKGQKKKPWSENRKHSLSKKKSKYTYEFTSPDSVVYITHSIRAFSKEHGLNRCGLGNLVKGITKKGNYKGWKGKIIKYKEK